MYISPTFLFKVTLEDGTLIVPPKKLSPAFQDRKDVKEVCVLVLLLVYQNSFLQGCAVGETVPPSVEPAFHGAVPGSLHCVEISYFLFCFAWFSDEVLCIPGWPQTC